MATIEEVKAGLAQAVDEANRAIAGILAARDCMDRAVFHLGATAAGSGAPKISQSIAEWEGAKARLAEAAQLATAGITTAGEYSAFL
jgi:hypothetical protein